MVESKNGVNLARMAVNDTVAIQRFLLPKRDMARPGNADVGVGWEIQCVLWTGGRGRESWR